MKKNHNRQILALRSTQVLVLLLLFIVQFSIFGPCPKATIVCNKPIGLIDFITETNTSTDVLDPAFNKGYLLLNSSCHIPDVHCWHNTIKGFIKPSQHLTCSSKPPLSKVQDNTLQLVLENKMLYHDNGDISCCYQTISRPESTVYDGWSDNKYSLGACVSLNSSQKLTEDEQFILVKCETNNGVRVYTNLHARVVIKKNVRLKLKKTSIENKRNMSVLILVIDSLSRLNLFRTMPKTGNLLRRSGWVEMQGYNKVGYNTLPNSMAFTTGLNEDDVRKTCYLPESPLENCPIIWKAFSERGYVTAYGEDTIHIGTTFNLWNQKGFWKPPTDYYMRPFFKAAEELLELKKKSGMVVCAGPTLEVDHVFTYALDFVKTFRHYLTFGIFWVNGLTHNDVSTPQALDDLTLNLLQNLEHEGILKNTFVMLMSDHGVRYGKITKTFSGWLEERLPCQFIWLPDWFKQQQPEKYTNLLNNARKLTSSYDIYLTLREVMGDSPGRGTKSCPRCASLFQDIPRDRSCSDAGIPEEWCACSRYSSLTIQKPFIQKIVGSAIDHINAEIKLYSAKMGNFTKCAELSVRRILISRSQVLSNNRYVIAFETVPGNGVFETTLIYKKGKTKLLTAYRMNNYEHQSCCTTDNILKQFCFCIDV